MKIMMVSSLPVCILRLWRFNCGWAVRSCPCRIKDYLVIRIRVGWGNTQVILAPLGINWWLSGKNIINDVPKIEQWCSDFVLFCFVFNRGFFRMFYFMFVCSFCFVCCCFCFWFFCVCFVLLFLLVMFFLFSSNMLCSHDHRCSTRIM